MNISNNTIKKIFLYLLNSKKKTFYDHKEVLIKKTILPVFLKRPFI